MNGICKGCGCRFPRKAHLPTQEYCSKKACQNKRKNEWRKQKLAKDPDYKEQKKESQARWAGKNPDYWKNYRANHPEYVVGNRQQQKRRNMARKEAGAGEPEIAKSDATFGQNFLNTGAYMLERVDSGKIAKSDGYLFNIRAIPDRYGSTGEIKADCKEMT